MFRPVPACHEGLSTCPRPNVPPLGSSLTRVPHLSAKRPSSIHNTSRTPRCNARGIDTFRVTAGSAEGLDDEEAARRAAAGRANVVGEEQTRTVGDILRANIVTRFNALLGSLLVVILIVGPVQDALFGLVLIGNTVVGVVQELRAKHTLERLVVIGGA